MSGAKEIRTKIGSVKSTQKITKAMELVAASKMRKAQERMMASKPYAKKIYEVISHVAHASSDSKPAFLLERPLQNMGVIVISSDRGLCGGLNVNLFKKVLAFTKPFSDKGVGVQFGLVGAKAVSFFSAVGGDVAAAVTGLGDAPTVEQLIGAVSVMLKAYKRGKIDRLLIGYNEFVNTMTQQPEILQLLPVQKSEVGASKHQWDYLYEPSATEILEALILRYIESQVYQAVADNIACEQAARMVAMKAATD
ncbi:MAG: F0F1 ATP synthase subunit gamma, partial [Gammaproteobacteria bacterium]